MSRWAWETFRGSPQALKFNRRDLPHLVTIIAACAAHRVAIQAGGHLGIWPKRLAASFKTVYTFEPAPTLFAALQANAPEPNIIRLQAALGDVRGPVGLSQRRRHGRMVGDHEGLTHIEGSGVLPTLCIDDLAVPVCDLICLDVEGYELPALRGAHGTLRRCRPVVAAEVNENCQHYGFTPEDLHGFLRDQGYAYSFRAGSDDIFLPAERTGCT